MQALPEELKQELPTGEDFAREFPLMTLVGLRIDIERELRDLAAEIGLDEGLTGLGYRARRLSREGILAANLAGELYEVARFLNAAAHGLELSREDAEHAHRQATELLTKLRELRPS